MPKNSGKNSQRSTKSDCQLKPGYAGDVAVIDVDALARQRSFFLHQFKGSPALR